MLSARKTDFDRVEGWLETASWALIAGIGAWLLVGRLWALVSGGATAHSHGHGHATSGHSHGGHDHDHSHDHDHGEAKPAKKAAAKKPKKED